MMSANTNLREVIEKAYAISSEYLLPKAKTEIETERNELLTELKENEVIKVPIVGDFSAGKSSLVNALLREGNTSGISGEVLPVNITPETAIAYEVHAAVGGKEEAVLYREGREIVHVALNQLSTMATCPGDIARVYVNAPKIAELENRGIVLVDMPGIDSGIQEHNDALLHYINKGTAFVLLVDAGQGAIRTSTAAFMTELSKYNLKPALLISKMEKKPASELAEIKEFFCFQSRKLVGDEVYVGCVSAHENNIKDFTDYLDGINAEKLVKERMASRIVAYVNKQISYLSAQAELLSVDIEDVEQKIQNLEQQKLQLEQNLNNNPTADTPQKSTQDILDQVRMELMSHTEEIATMLVNREDQNSISACILGYVRPVLIQAFKEEGEQYAEAMNSVVDDVSRALQDSLKIEKGLLEDIIDEFHDEIVGALVAAAQFLIHAPNIFAKALGWVLQLLGEKVPDILRWIFGKSKEDLVLEVNEKIRFSIVDKIVDSLHDFVFDQVVAQQQRIRQHIQRSLEGGINNMQDAVRHSSENRNKEDMETQLRQLDAAVKELENLKSCML